MGECGLPRTKQNVYRSKGFDESYPKNVILLNLSHCVQCYGIHVKFYHENSQIMVMSRDPSYNFENYIFALFYIKF